MTRNPDYHLQAENNGGAVTNLLVGDPDGSVDLYYDGSKVGETLILAFGIVIGLVLAIVAAGVGLLAGVGL